MKKQDILQAQPQIGRVADTLNQILKFRDGDGSASHSAKEAHTILQNLATDEDLEEEHFIKGVDAVKSIADNNTGDEALQSAAEELEIIFGIANAPSVPGEAVANIEAEADDVPDDSVLIIDNAFSLLPGNDEEALEAAMEAIRSNEEGTIDLLGMLADEQDEDEEELDITDLEDINPESDVELAALIEANKGELSSEDNL